MMWTARHHTERFILGVMLVGCLLLMSELLKNLESRCSHSSESVRDNLERKLIGSEKQDAEALPTIYMITATYRRPEQIPELTRTGQTLLHVKNLVWIVVEDTLEPSSAALEYLERCGATYVYMTAQVPDSYQDVVPKPRGVANKNVALEWVRQHTASGVVYFGDDDNSYDLRIFEEIRWTKKVSMFPVGLISKTNLNSPIVKEGKVIGFYDGWTAKRKFHVDMAGFAVHVDLIKKNPRCTLPYIESYQETLFLTCLLIELSDIEPKANNCTEILVWHTQTVKNAPAVDIEVKMPLENTNIIELKKMLRRST